MQTKKMSLIESVADIGLGFLLSVITQEVLFYWFSISSPFYDNVKMTVIFCIIGLARTYAVRRIFRRFENNTRH